MSETFLDIPAIRKALNLTQSQLADMAGVNLSTVWRWENDGVPKRGPARALLDRLKLEAFGIDSSPASSSAGDAGASSPNSDAPAVRQGRAEVARLAHNQEVAGSNPVPVTSFHSPDILPSGDNAGAQIVGLACAPATECQAKARVDDTGTNEFCPVEERVSRLADRRRSAATSEITDVTAGETAP